MEVAAVPSEKVRRKALVKLIELLKALDREVDVVLVEGSRDVIALQRLGFRGRIKVCSRVGISNSDLVEDLARSASAVAIFTDFDAAGRRLNRRLTRLLELRGVRVEARLRRTLRRLMAVLGVYAVEALDNVAEELNPRL
jgi:5S rRNA maturation endonuclease (ribonuclease M5)